MLIRNLTDDLRLFAPIAADPGMSVAGAEPSSELKDLVRSTGESMGLESNSGTPAPAEVAGEEAEPETQLNEQEVDSEEPEVRASEYEDYFRPKPEAPAETAADTGDEVSPPAEERDEELLRFAQEMGLPEELASAMPDAQLRAVTLAMGKQRFPVQPQQQPTFQPPEQNQVAPPPYQAQPPAQPAPDPVATATAATEAALQAAIDEGHGDEITGLVKAIRAESAAKEANHARELQTMQQHLQAIEGNAQAQQHSVMEARSSKVNGMIDGLGNQERYGTTGQYTQLQAHNAVLLDNQLFAAEQEGVTVTPTVMRTIEAMLFGESSPVAPAPTHDRVQASKARALQGQAKRRMGPAAKAATTRETQWTGEADENPKLLDFFRRLQQDSGAV